jgi:hypothetical protein
MPSDHNTTATETCPRTDNATPPFGVITRQAIRRGSFRSAREVVDAIGRFIDNWNDPCEPVTRDQGRRHHPHHSKKDHPRLSQRDYGTLGTRVEMCLESPLDIVNRQEQDLSAAPGPIAIAASTHDHS